MPQFAFFSFFPPIQKLHFCVLLYFFAFGPSVQVSPERVVLLVLAEGGRGVVGVLGALSRLCSEE